MANNYYSGQGSLYVATRNASTGKAEGFIPVGNVPELTLDIEATNFEHKESESGSRLLDLVVNKEKKGKFNFKLENLSLDNLALGLWGEKATVAGATATDELVWVSANPGGKRYALANPKVTAFTSLKSNDGLTTYIKDTDYSVDLVNGTLTIIEGAAIDTALAAAGSSLKATYTYGAHIRVDAFTQAAAPERWLRFEGLNTVDGKTVIIDIFRAQFDPLTGYGLINEELGSVDMKGAVLSDSLQAGNSKFFRQQNVS